MKFLVVLAVAVACVAADVSHVVPVPKYDEFSAPIVKSVYESQPDGNYGFNYETGNGIVAHAEGVVRNIAPDTPAVEVTGDYSYTAPDGTLVRVSYVANENGYQPQGDLLPTPHPVPEHVLRSLKFIAEHTPVERVVVKNI